MTIFTQWEKLVSVFRGIAEAAASEKALMATVRHDLSGGSATLADGAVNLVTLPGGGVTLRMPEAVPGKARRLVLRADARETTRLTFEGALFEGISDFALAPPAAGETVAYTFIETLPGVLWVTRHAFTGRTFGG